MKLNAQGPASSASWEKSSPGWLIYGVSCIGTRCTRQHDVTVVSRSDVQYLSRGFLTTPCRAWKNTG